MERLSTRFQHVTTRMNEDRLRALHNFKIESQRRRKLLDEIQMLKGSIRVICRIRPQVGASEQTEAVAVAVDDLGRITACSASTGITKRAKKDQFSFSHTFGPGSTQEAVFSEVSHLVDSALDGYHACIFAYGQTGAGKTFTMEGSPSNPGINQRAFGKLFSEIDNRQESYDFNVKATMVEIYNEKLRDLLRQPTTNNSFEASYVKLFLCCTFFFVVWGFLTSLPVA